METQMLTDASKFLIDHLEGVAGSIAVILSLWVIYQTAKDKKIEIYMELFEKWDDNWSKIVAHPEQNKNLFKKTINQFDSSKDEDLKYHVYLTMSILSRVHYYYRETHKDITKSDWQREVNYIMSYPLFVSAYEKNKEKSKYNPSFVKYMDKAVEENKEKRENYKNVVDVKIPKVEGSSEQQSKSKK